MWYNGWDYFDLHLYVYIARIKYIQFILALEFWVYRREPYINLVLL